MFHPDELLVDLNDEQRNAVMHDNGPLLIVAGAGTGKTTVISRRIAWLIMSGKCNADEILALTFTDKAAGEMEERVDRLLPYGYVNLWISTFHSFCERILKSHAFDIGLSNDFKLLDQTATWLLMRQNLDRFNLDYYRPLGNPAKFIHALLKHFSRAKDEEISPKEYLEYAEKLRLDGDDPFSGIGDEVKRITEIANAYHIYEQLLLENNALDFGSLILYTLKLFRQRPAILEKYQKQFKFLLIDEFQDTNWAQYELIKLLAAPQNNIAVVGDDDQSVYKFRGASLANILAFKKDFSGSREVFLVKNYRSTQNILDAAYGFIQQNNPDRLEYQLAQQGESAMKKQLQAQTPNSGTVEHIHCATLDDEIEEILKKMLAIRDEDGETTWGDFAILIRSNDLANPFIHTFHERGIPYQFLGLKGLYTKPIVIDCIAYLAVLSNVHEGPAFYRVLNLPFFGISLLALVQLGHSAYKKGNTLWQVATKIDVEADISEEDQQKIKNVASLVEKHAALTRKSTPGEILVHFLQDSGYLAFLKAEETIERLEMLSYLNQFYQKMKKFQTEYPQGRLRDFMAYLSLEQEAGDEGRLTLDMDVGSDAVKIMTVHGSKGLEFPYVFVVNLVDRRFPTIERNDGIDIPEPLIKEKTSEGDIHLQEERRLFYVAMTRAKKGLFFTSGEDYGGARKKKLSRFLAELGYGKAGYVPSSIHTKKELPSLRHAEREHPHNGAWKLPTSFSFTQLAAFQKCPLQYKYAFLLRIPTFGRPSFSFGKTMHATLQHFFQKIVDTAQTGYTNTKKIPPLEELLELYKREWIDEWYPSQKLKDEYTQKGQEILVRLHGELETSLPSPKALERDFTIKVGSGIDIVTVRGRIDRIDSCEDGSIEIIDYKTGESKDMKNFRAEDKEQLILYQIAAEDVFGEKVARLTYQYLEDGKKVSFLGDEEEKMKLKEKAAGVLQDMKQSNFEATPGFHCRFCDFKDICEFRAKQ
ncbi:MAG: UvrD-helicase domain-containing protein [bacterium]|nr:UvrD-helicase domain-containing protein [bacterium]